MKGRLKFTGKIILFSLILSVFLLNSTRVYCTQIINSDSTLLFLDPCFYEVEKHNIKIDILNIEEVIVAERFEVKNTHNSSLNSINLWINQTLSNLIVTDYNGSLLFEDTTILQSSHLLNITFRSDLESNATTSFNIWYDLERNPISEHGNSYYFFEFYFTTTYFTREQFVEVKIPERSFIHEEDGITPYFPSDGYALAGQRIYLSWTFENLDPLEQSFIFVRFDKPLQETPIIAIILGTIGGIILGVGITVLVMKRREKKVVKQISTIYLSDTQKTLLKLISENDGKMLQKELCAATEFTKSRISRNITPLVEQGLVKRERWGRNYVIKLTENGMKVVE